MMNQSESYVFTILNKHKKFFEEWKFFEVSENGTTSAQAKDYGNGFVSYPDFEFYSNKKLLLLVEVKGYLGFFDNRKNVLAMRLRQFRSYKEVQKQERVEVRLCFVISDNGKNTIYWQSLNNINKFEYGIEEYSINSVKEKYIFWDCSDFKTDENNLSRV